MVSKQTAAILDSVNKETTEEPDIFVAESGVVLKLKKVNGLIISELGRKIKEPRVPKVYIEDKGREEENPNDPDYLEALQDVAHQRAMLTIDTYYALGTEPKSIPENIKAIEDTDWSEDLAVIGLEVPTSGRGRYLAWLKYYILTQEEALGSLLIKCTRYSGGVTEEDVEAATATFRNNAARDTDITVPVEEETKLRD